MCLAIPMRILGIDGFTARCEARGALRDVSLFLLQDDLPTVGDYVQVQTGYAIHKVDEDTARGAWELFDQILREGTP
ncbi:MAG TPA: HypC/HybG/HupF family hydrogenase formation chaperone [Thiobacillaceae bacterium]|nr:HypC/HybG/HupF family hydrogenase formation chaperone [Thiobacillaceae bacterium]HNU64043.1 HypC/HybG/HupF family hydrogenase formation chaperone [Thiobacillaceae bacterium]